MIKLLDWLKHRWRFEFVPSAEINSESGTMDFYCSCWLCRLTGRANG